MCPDEGTYLVQTNTYLVQTNTYLVQTNTRRENKIGNSLCKTYQDQNTDANYHNQTKISRSSEILKATPIAALSMRHSVGSASDPAEQQLLNPDGPVNAVELS